MVSKSSYFFVYVSKVRVILLNGVTISMKGDAFYYSNVSLYCDSLALTNCACKAGSQNLG